MDYLWKKTACPYDCPDGCGLIVKTDGEKIYETKADPEHPVTKGFICRKMQRYENSVNSEKRILRPLKRTGHKGEGRFEEITWDEASEIIASKWNEIIEKYGSDTILPYSFAGVEHLFQNKCGEAFFNRLGAANLVRTICSPAKDAGFGQITGDYMGISPEEMEESDYIIIWGSNIKATWLHAYAAVKRAKARGAKVVLVETYKTHSADVADEAVLVKPGTDAALALGMAAEISRKGLIDREFTERYCSGTDEFLESIKGYTSAKCSAITLVPCETIEKIAEEYAKASNPCIIFGSGMTRHGNGAMTVRAITTLPAITGAFAKRGGGIVGNMSSGRAYNSDIIKRPDFKKEGMQTINMNQLGMALAFGSENDADGAGNDSADSLKTEQTKKIRSLYVYNCNPASVAPDQKSVIAGLKREDLFTVVHERFMTDTARYADIVLPADFSVERYDINAPYGFTFTQKILPAVPAPGECRSNWDTFRTLADKMGFEEEHFKMSAEELIGKMLENRTDWMKRWTEEENALFEGGSAVMLPEIRFEDYFCQEGGSPRKIMLVNEELEHRVPSFIPFYGGEEPLRLVVSPGIYSLNTTFTEREDLKEKRGRMSLMINPADANERGIKDGDRITAYNALAEVEFYALVTDNTKQGTVIAESMYSAEDSLNGLTVNALLSQRLTDYAEASTLCDNNVEVRKV